jgi:protein-tyrosine phosphatase
VTQAITRPSCVLLVCTGNVARSVMAEVMLSHLAREAGVPVVLRTAGTVAVEGQPMGARTKRALDAVAGLPEGSARRSARHRSAQLDTAHLVGADVVVTMEADHVRYLRRRHPEVADRAATLRRLCRDLPAGDEPLASRVERLSLAEVELGDWEDVADPAGGDDTRYQACADELWDLIGILAERL